MAFIKLNFDSLTDAINAVSYYYNKNEDVSIYDIFNDKTGYLVCFESKHFKQCSHCKKVFSIDEDFFDDVCSFCSAYEQKEKKQQQGLYIDLVKNARG